MYVGKRSLRELGKGKMPFTENEMYLFTSDILYNKDMAIIYI